MGWQDSFIHFSKQFSQEEIESFLEELGFGKVGQIIRRIALFRHFEQVFVATEIDVSA